MKNTNRLVKYELVFKTSDTDDKIHNDIREFLDKISGEKNWTFNDVKDQDLETEFNETKRWFEENNK